MLIEGADYFVRFVDFPNNANCGGMVLLNEDGTFSVYLDPRRSTERIKKTMRHEYAHMENDDLYGDKDIRTIENV